jgi:hypothetical protein
MKLESIPENEASKLRLLKELPLHWHEGVMNIIERAATWESAKSEIAAYLSNREMRIKNVRILFESKFPVGAQRKNKR